MSNRYAIVHDATDGTYWLQGDEGRVGDHPCHSLTAAIEEAIAMSDRGCDVDLNYYYEYDADDGADWANPRPI